MNKIDLIKAKVSMEDLLSHFGINIGKGNRINCICPEHIDNDPSMKVDLSNNKVHCFSCGFTGDIFDVTMKIKGYISLAQAITYLGMAFNLGIDSRVTEAQKMEMARLKVLMEAKKLKDANMAAFLEKTLQEIIDKLRFYDSVARDTEIQKGDNRSLWSDEWGDIYFNAIKQIKWLNWLYYTICELDTGENEFVYLYGNDVPAILEQIKNKEIIF